jgi:hypothetical protein
MGLRQDDNPTTTSRALRAVAAKVTPYIHTHLLCDSSTSGKYPTTYHIVRLRENEDGSVTPLTKGWEDWGVDHLRRSPEGVWSYQGGPLPPDETITLIPLASLVTPPIDPALGRPGRETEILTFEPPGFNDFVLAAKVAYADTQSYFDAAKAVAALSGTVTIDEAGLRCGPATGALFRAPDQVNRSEGWKAFVRVILEGPGDAAV